MSDTQPDPRRRGNVPLLMAGVMALLTIGAMIWLKVASPTEPPFPNNLGNGEKIANAIATPPAPVPGWLSFLYPWQTLLSADLALIAALIGAWAIMAQVQGSLDAVHTQIRAAREDEKTRLAHERQAQLDQVFEQQKGIAGAIAAELASWMNRFGQYRSLQQYKTALALRNVSAPAIGIPPIYGADRFSVFESVCDKLGDFDPPIPEHVVTSYGALRGTLDILREVRAPPPSFESDVDYTTTTLRNLVVELSILDKFGRLAIDRLVHVYGIRPPDVPPWL